MRETGKKELRVVYYYKPMGRKTKRACLLYVNFEHRKSRKIYFQWNKINRDENISSVIYQLKSIQILISFEIKID